MGIVWSDNKCGYKINRIFLPNKAELIEKCIKRQFIYSTEKSSPQISDLISKINNFLDGEKVDFDLNNIALETCTNFQRRVLLLEYKIPRGWISTYGRIAYQLGVLYGARAVGNALSKNPFPIVIPCHRAIRSDGSLGGFQGGIKMKKTLLKYEGIEFSKYNKVLMKNIYY
jgi:methylated-DNA-[protein]-cysteine S-methyltransferase